MSENWSHQTRMIHQSAGRSEFGETSEALYLTSGFVYDSPQRAQDRFKGEDDGYIYSRFGNPTVTTFETRMAAREGTEVCFGTASGMAAVFAALACQVQAGDHIVASRVLFGSCLQVVTHFLARFGVTHTLVDGHDTEAWSQAIRPETKLLFCESPANPTLDLVDIEAVANLAKAHKICFVVDNAFASPVVQNPTQLGADVVVYSATKHIDGQGRCLGGAVCCSQDFFDELLMPFVRHTGPSLSPFNAWVLAKALETLDLRVNQMAKNALAVATALVDTKNIKRVIYPGLASHRHYEVAQRQMRSGGTMIALKIDGDQARAFEILTRLKLVKISNNLGDAKSLITHPATTTHRAMEPEHRYAVGISDTMLRLSIGLESADDLIEDLQQALTG